ncbi:MAG TPA: cytochrome c biogenesis protein CcdA [Verrucomicrobiae bacterium]|nr:cytochrome c biogenesis protein CcdA [Verrucomicrobiae bacterium]
MFTENISLLAALGAGFISFISPCVLPLIPGYLSFISGVSVADMSAAEKRAEVLRKVALSSFIFVLGFSAVFITLGASATAVGKFLLSNKIGLFNRIAGVVIVILGLHVMGVIRIPFLNYEKRIQTRSKPLGALGTFLVGVAFAFGWTPCIGPILGGILGLAANQGTVGQGMLLLTFYSLGLGIPFLITAVSFNWFIGFSGFFKKHFRTIEIVSGLLLVGIGVLIFFNRLGALGNWLLETFPALQNIG